MKCVSYFFYIGLFFLIQSIYTADFFQLEHLPQGTKIPILKLVNLIPAAANTPLKNAQLEDVYIQAVAETPAVNAHIEMFGKMKLKTSLPGLQNVGDLDLSVIGKLFSAFGRGAAPVTSPTALPESQPTKTTVDEALPGQINPFIFSSVEAVLSELPKGFTKQTEYAGYKNVYVEDVAKGPGPRIIIPAANKYVLFDSMMPNYGLSEQKVKQFIKDFPKTPDWQTKQRTAVQAARDEDMEKTIAKAFAVTAPGPQSITDYDDAISILKELSTIQTKLEDWQATQNLLSRLTTEKANVGKPGSTATAITEAKNYIKRPDITAIIEQQIIAGLKQTEELEQIPKQPRAQTLEEAAEEEIQPKPKQPTQPIEPIRPLSKSEIETIEFRFQSAMDNLEKIRGTESQVQSATGRPIAISTLLTLLDGARSAFEKNKNRTDIELRNIPVLNNTEDIIVNFYKKSAPTVRPQQYLTQEQITQTKNNFINVISELQKRINATPEGNEKTQLQQRLNTVKQNQELFGYLMKSVEAGEQIPIGTLQTYTKFLQSAAQFLAQQPFVQPQAPILLSGKEFQLFKEITSKTTSIVSELPIILRKQYKDSSIWVASSPLSTQAAIPVGDKFILLQTNFPIKGFLDSIPLNILENFGNVISRDAQAWQKFTDLLHTGKPTEAEIEAVLPKAKPLTEYEQKRDSLMKGIESLNKIISQRTSEITRVGAALFLITLQNPNYRPFQNIQLPDLPPIDVPGIKDIELNNTELGVFLAPPQVFSIWAQGTGRVINIPLLAKVLFNYEKMQDPTTKRMVDNTGVVLQAGLPEAWKFSDSFPEMKSFDRLVIKRAYVYVSTINYIDYTIPTQLMPAPSIAIANVPGRPTVGMLPGIAIRPGLSLYGEINLRKLIPEIFDHLKFAGLETASMYGTISNKPENCQIGIGLPDLVKIENSPFKLGGVWAEIHAKNLPGIGFEPEVSLVIALVIQPSPKDETLTFTARGSTDAVSGMVAFSMQGFWNNALGIEGLSIGNLAIQLHADYKAVLSGVPITGFGFTGTIKFGTQVESPIIRFASLYAMTSAGQEVAVQGKLDGTISIWQIIDGCKSLAIKKAQQDKKSTKDVEDNYNKILNNAVAKQFGNIAIRNVDMKVAPSTVRIGEFFIMQGFTAKGELTLLGVTAGMEFNLGQSGLTATGYLSPIKIGDVFSLTGAGMDKQYGTPDDGATMSLALNFLKQHFIITGQVKLLGIQQQTDIFVDTEGLNCTIAGKLFNLFDASVVLKSRGDITNPDLYFKASMKQEFTKYIIDETIKALRASTKDSVAKITDAQNEVNKLSANVTDLEQQINSRKKRIDQLSPNFLEGVKNSPEITKLGIEIAGLETGKAGAIAARETAKVALEGAKGIVGGGSVLAEALINISVPLDIRESAIEASVQDIAKGKLPRFTAVASIAGKKLNLDMQLDFSSPEKAQQSANAIAQQILALFK